MKRWTIATAALCLATAGAAQADSPLADAIQAGERANALRLIQGGADVNATQPDGATPLHWAVFNVDYELARQLLRRRADPDVTNAYGSSPLSEAASIADLELMRMLLDAGANPDSPNQDGQTALMLAIRTGVTEAARLLVRAGADVNAKESFRDQTPLMWAAGLGHADIVDLLIENGADVHVRAAANDWERQITSEPRAQYRASGGLTPLLYAARQDCMRCVVAIVEAGADVNLPNPDGVTPLIIAIDNYAYDAALYLMDQGADPHRWDWHGRTPLYVAVDMNTYRPGRGGFDPDGFSEGRSQNADSQTTAMDVVRRLLAEGADPNAQLNLWRPTRPGAGRFVDDSFTIGTTPLFVAAVSQDFEAMRALLDAGALVDLPNVMGNTPLMGAAGMGMSLRDSRGYFTGNPQDRIIDTLKILLEAGADINARLTDTTSRTGRIARPSSLTDKQGQTALFSAASWGWADVVRFLLDNGADATVVDDFGKTTVDAARNQAGGRERGEFPEIIDMLVEAGAAPSPPRQEAAATP